MSTLVTLFGGLVAIVVLWFLLGFARALPSLFRALIAGGVPLAAYFVSLAGMPWPGLDGVAIHISVYLATGALLYILGEYRRHYGRLHWVPRLLVAFFILLAVINASLLHIATRGLPGPVARWWLGDTVESGFSGVVEHDKGAAKGVSTGLAQAYRENLLGWQITSEGLLQDGSAKRDVVLRARDRTGLPLAGLDARLVVSRPGTRVPVAEFELPPTAPGEYAGRINLPEHGRWLVEIRLQNESGQFSETRELVAP